jgi:hypothetical protein
MPGIQVFGHVLEEHLAEIIPVLFKPFVPLDAQKTPPGPQQFQDYGYAGLPMDNGVDDVLMPTYFTEIWIPVSKTQAVMTALRDHFAKGGKAHRVSDHPWDPFDRSIELYQTWHLAALEKMDEISPVNWARMGCSSRGATPRRHDISGRHRSHRRRPADHAGCRA